MKAASVHLATLNDAPLSAAVAYFHGCCSAPAFSSVLADNRPYADIDAVLAAADAAFAQMADADIDVAIAGHPRIGEQPTGAGADAAHSRREQASISDADAAVQEEIRQVNLAYEQRFNRVFLIRAAGRTPQEMLAQARRRLNNNPATELTEVREQLRQITRLRLEQSLQNGTPT